jgi:hypothetical protein
MTYSNLRLLASFIPIGFLAVPLKADTLGDASLALRNADYARAKNLVVNYYAHGGARRYRADFIRAVSDCRLSKGQGWARNNLRALMTDYLLTPAASSEVNQWLGACKPPQPQQAEAGEPHSIASGLTVPPSTSVALNGPEPMALARMSALISGTAFRGDDYASPRLSSPQDCQRQCQLQAPCKSITYDWSTKICWMKRSVPARGYSSQFVSSIKVTN